MNKIEYLEDCIAEIDFMYKHELLTQSEYLKGITSLKKQLKNELSEVYDSLELCDLLSGAE